MLTENDRIKLNALANEREDFRYLIEKLKEEQQFTVSQISHEIRNPVTLINSSLQLIETQHPEVKDFSLWPQVMDDMIFLRNLLNELSSYNNGEHLKLSDLSTDLWLNSIIQSFHAYMAESSKTFTYTIEPFLPKIQADETKLHQAIHNLLRNAVEAIEPNGSVSLSAHQEDNHVVLTIEDTGCGIPEEYMETLFTPFVTHKQNGTGLGLCISKRIVEAHQGSLSVTSVPGTGTCFTIRLPLTA